MKTLIVHLFTERKKNEPNDHDLFTEFQESLFDDLNTPKALGVLNKILNYFNKSINKEKERIQKFGNNLTYPDAYKTVKDTSNFVWIEKQVTKGHLNIIAYALPEHIDLKKLEVRIPEIRDSIGKIYIPGRVPGSYMITERAYLPYFYKTQVNNLDAILTKGTWEVQNDFMAGPYVNYIIKDTLNKRNIVIEGFSFAPSESKRDYMFELNTIITTMKLVN